jgi:FemAB-related protein (PEP-CTERM system-associated)
VNATPSAIEVRPARAQDAAACDAFVREHPSASFFHQSAWSRTVAAVFGHAPCDLTAWSGDRLVGFLPLSSCRSPLGSAALISVPYAVYGGPVAEDAQTSTALVRAAMLEAERRRARRLELRCESAPEVPGLVPHELYATFVRALPATCEEVLARMPKKSRAEARKARDKHGLSLSEGEWYLDDFHRLFHQNKRALGSPGLPLDFFRALLGAFGRDARVHVVHHQGEVVSAVMSFLWRGTCLAYYSGTRPGADRELSASNFLYLALQEWCVREGLTVFDFGRSRRDSGAFQFKEHQGFEARVLPYRLHLVRDRAAPSFTPSNPRTARLRETWSRLPPWLCERLSAFLAPYLP